MPSASTNSVAQFSVSASQLIKLMNLSIRLSQKKRKSHYYSRSFSTKKRRLKGKCVPKKLKCWQSDLSNVLNRTHDRTFAEKCHKTAAKPKTSL